MFRWRTYLLLLIIIICIVAIFIIPYYKVLIFYEKNTDNVAAYLPIKAPGKFDLIFTHSIHLTDVVERYELLTNGDILQYEIIFEEFGIGMPSTVQPHERYYYEAGKHHIKDMNNVFSLLKIRNGKTVSENRLVWYEEGEIKQVYLNEYFAPGDWFTIKVDKLSLLQLLREVKIND